MNLIGSATAEITKTAHIYIKLWAFYVNIFFMAGIIYLIMAFLKFIKTPLWGYVVISIITALLSTAFANYTTGTKWIDIILSLFFTSTPYASFGFVPYIGFTCTGYVFGCAMQLVGDKTSFYKKASLISGIILIVAAVIFFIKFPTLELKYNELYDQYIHAGLLKLIVSDAAMVLMFAFFYFICSSLEKLKWLSTKVRYIAKNISKYYAIHVPIYVFLSILTGFAGNSAIRCIIIYPIVMFITDAIVKIYNRLHSKTIQAKI